MRFYFGDVLVNEWASNRNPIRVGIFVRKKSHTVVMTDGKGYFWESKTDRLVKVGTVLKANLEDGQSLDLSELDANIPA